MWLSCNLNVKKYIYIYICKCWEAIHAAVVNVTREPSTIIIALLNFNNIENNERESMRFCARSHVVAAGSAARGQVCANRRHIVFEIKRKSLRCGVTFVFNDFIVIRRVFWNKQIYALQFSGRALYSTINFFLFKYKYAITT